MRLNSAIADRIEQLLAVLFYGWFCWRFVVAIAAGATDPRVYAVLIADGTILLFLLARRPTAGISMRWSDWLWAVVGTTAGLLIQPVATPLAPDTGLALVLAGTGFALVAKFVLRRSFGLVAANRGVKLGGPYRLVRHPMYAGYLVSHIGTLLLLPSLWNLAIYAVAWVGLGLRIAAEERLLSSDPVYASYCERTPWRLVPGLY